MNYKLLTMDRHIKYVGGVKHTVERSTLTVYFQIDSVMYQLQFYPKAHSYLNCHCLSITVMCRVSQMLFQYMLSF